jgi:pilus assembly protein CpaB
MIALAGALMISGCASYIVYRLQGGGMNSNRRVRTIQLVAAARNLEVGTLVRDTDLKFVDWAGPVPAGSTTKKAAAISRGVISTIYVDEPLTENRLAPSGSGGGLAATIRAGMRACAVKVNEVVGVAGFVTPGMRVDVLITGIPPGASTIAASASRTLLQNIEVLSAGTNIEKNNEGKPQQVQVVNLLVTPHQAETLSLAGNETRIQLILRNPADTEITSPPGSRMSDLFGSSPAPVSVAKAPAPKVLTPAAPPEPPKRIDPPKVIPMDTVEVLNGATHTVTKSPAAGASQ